MKNKERREVTLQEACIVTKQNTAAVTETEMIPIENACGRIAAEDVSADFDQPSFDRSPLDGFAVRSADIAEASPESPAELSVIDEVCAGEISSSRIGPGQAVRIMTGAPIPSGGDCVVKQEDTESDAADGGFAGMRNDEGCAQRGEIVRICRSVDRLQNFCSAGEDFRRGQIIIERERKLNFTDVGLLASLGRTQVNVFRRPRAAVIATGDEIVLPGKPRAPGKIYNSNMFMIRAGVTSCGGEVPHCVQSEDSLEAIMRHLSAAVEKADMVITTGGVSVGKKDYLPEALNRLGAEILFQRISIKPGSPTTFSLLSGKPVLSLTGSPFGAAVNFNLLIRPMIGVLSRDSSLDLGYIYAVFRGTFEKESPKTRYIQGILGTDGSVRLKPLKNSAAGKGGNFSACRTVLPKPEEKDCYIEIPAGSKGLKGGEILRVVCI